MSKKIVEERMKILFKKAKENVKTNPALSKRYVRLIRKLSLKNNVKIPSYIKREICKCDNVLIPGYNCSVRIKNKIITIICNNCKKIKRYKLKIK